MTNNCLLCYQELHSDEIQVHTTCCRKLYGRKQPPKLPYGLDELGKLAKQIISRSVTVPGVQAKLSLNLAEKGEHSGRFTLVGLWGNYILKPPTNRFPQMPEIEDLSMHLARFFKIDTVPHGLIPLKTGELAYITRRIDRDRQRAKLHMEDMCQLNERLTEDKYKGSMERISKIIVTFSSNPGLDVIRFFDIAIFSFLIGNADMHLKNFSLIHDEKFITLTPAYDMLSTRLLISEKDDSEEMALTLNGKKSRFKLRDFTKFAYSIGLNEKQVENSFKRFHLNLKPAISFIDQSLLSDENKGVFKALLSDRAKRLDLI